MPPEFKSPTTYGRVRLVGAGPGAADLLTVRALRAIEGAQALLYDALIDDEVLALAPAACLKLQTGKRAGRPSMKQETINALMLRLARRGLDVVRLKGGDPSIFGRVGEEAAYLRAHGIEVEVTPGVTAACAAAAQFGFPLTHRGEVRQVIFTTARLEAGSLQMDWRAAADPQATLAIYMGGTATAHVSAALIGAGRRPDTPALLISNASRPKAGMLQSTLGALAQSGPTPMDGPTLLIVGESARFAVSPWASEPAAQERAYG